MEDLNIAVTSYKGTWPSKGSFWTVQILAQFYAPRVENCSEDCCWLLNVEIFNVNPCLLSFYKKKKYLFLSNSVFLWIVVTFKSFESMKSFFLAGDKSKENKKLSNQFVCQAWKSMKARLKLEAYKETNKWPNSKMTFSIHLFKVGEIKKGLLLKDIWNEQPQSL